MSRFAINSKIEKTINQIRQSHSTGAVTLIHSGKSDSDQKRHESLLLFGMVEVALVESGAEVESAVAPTMATATASFPGGEEVQVHVRRALLPIDDCLLWYLFCLGGSTTTFGVEGKQGAMSSETVELAFPKEKVVFPEMLPDSKAIPKELPLNLLSRNEGLKWHEIKSSERSLFHFCDSKVFAEKIEPFVKKHLGANPLRNKSLRGSCFFVLEDPTI